MSAINDKENSQMQAMREATIEECAKLADKVAFDLSHHSTKAEQAGNTQTMYRANTAWRRVIEVATLIRALAAGHRAGGEVETNAGDSQMQAMREALEKIANIRPSLVPQELVDLFIEVRVTAKNALAATAHRAGGEDFTQCEKCWQPATCKKYGCREPVSVALSRPECGGTND
jgi:hypothetical protein